MSNILVVGSINQDISLRLNNFPEPGETVLAHDLSKSFGGKGANQAMTVAKLGQSISFIGAVGEDDAGREIVALMNEYSINTSGIRKSKYPTGSAYISLDANGENNIIVYPGANFDITNLDLESNRPLFESADFCIIQFEIPISMIESIVDFCNQYNVKVIINPAPFNPDFNLKLISELEYYIPNETEFLLTIGEDISKTYDLDFYIYKGQQFVNEYNCNLIITLGSKGSLLINQNTATLVPPHIVDVVDTTAAGDSYIGGFVTRLSQGYDALSAMNYASKVAALTIQKDGAINALPNRLEVESFNSEY